MYLSNTCKRRKRALWSIEGHLIRKSLMGKRAVGGGGEQGGGGGGEEDWVMAVTTFTP